MARRLDPPHDRAPLSRAERNTLARLERLLAEEPPPARGERPLEAVSRWLRRLRPALGPLVLRAAPWLAVLGVLALPRVIAWSHLAGALWLLMITAVASAWCVGRWVGWRRRLQEQEARRLSAER